MFSRIRFDRKFVFGALAILSCVLSLTLAPAARARNDVPDAMPTGTETVLYSFGVGPTPDKCKIKDGADPKGSLTYVPDTGLLFGRTSTTTSEGNGDGTIFQIMSNGTGYTVDHFFTGAKSDGNDPRHNAMTLVGTVLYGTTLTGGQHDNGSIFSINDDGAGYSSPLVFDFPKSATNNGGDQPHSCFVAAGSVLYGMTSQGGHNGGATGDGTIFAFDTSSATYTRLHSFDGKHGADPHGQLIIDTNGKKLYGMTRTGGKSDVGIVFSFSTIRFCPNPQAALSAIRRKLRPGGTAIIDFPNRYSPWHRIVKRLLGIPVHVHDTLYTKKEAVRLFEQAGFRVEGIRLFLFTTKRLPTIFLPLSKGVDFVFERLPFFRDLAGIIMVRGVKE